MAAFYNAILRNSSTFLKTRYINFSTASIKLDTTKPTSSDLLSEVQSLGNIAQKISPNEWEGKYGATLKEVLRTQAGHMD